jgi:hypothetical protein
LDWVAQIKKEQGKAHKIAEPEDDGPELFEDLIWIWQGFISLSHSRSVGMSGPLHITFSEINAYCSLYSITGHRKKIDFADHVTLLDSLWIEDYYEKDSERRKALDANKKNK